MNSNLTTYAKLFSLSLLSICALGCGKKQSTEEDPLPSPKFELLLSGYSSSSTPEQIRIRRLGSQNEAPTFLGQLKNMNEKMDSIRRHLVCDGHTLFDDSRPYNPSLLKLKVSKDTIPLLEYFYRVSDCQLSFTLQNEHQSTHQSKTSFKLIMDSPVQIKAKSSKPHVPPVANKPFAIDDLELENPGPFPIKFTYETQHQISLLPIWRVGTVGPVQINPGLDYRVANYTVKPLLIETTLDGRPTSTAGQSDFILEPNQKMKLKTMGQFMPGSESSYSFKPKCLGGDIIMTYMGARIAVDSIDMNLAQWDSIDSLSFEAPPEKQSQRISSETLVPSPVPMDRVDIPTPVQYRCTGLGDSVLIDHAVDLSVYTNKLGVPTSL